MLNAMTAEVLLKGVKLSLSLIRPNGDILYENSLAKEQLYHYGEAKDCIDSILTLSYRWEEVMEKLQSGEPVSDEPVMIRSQSRDDEMCYLTAISQYSPMGEIDSVLCIWSSRRNALNSYAAEGDSETVSEYTRDLESILEHRTYQEMLSTEQNELANEILDSLPVGIMIANPDGEIVSVNRAMSDCFGFHSATYLKPNIRYCLRPDLIELFDKTAATGLRNWVAAVDPGQQECSLDFLPIFRNDTVIRVAIQFCRFNEPVSQAPYNTSSTSSVVL